MSFGGRAVVLALLAAAFVLLPATGSGAATQTTLPPPIPTVTQGTTTTSTATTTSRAPTASTSPAPAVAPPAAAAQVGSPGEPSRRPWIGAAALALALAGASTVLTWRRQRLVH